LKTTQWEIDFNELVIEKEIGRGSYGVVLKGMWRSVPVAAKKMLTESMTEQNIVDFLTEISLMKSLRPHTNVVTLLGVCSNPLALITEYLENGSLWSYITKLGSTPSIEICHKVIVGIARGMLHLHLEKIVHRDLATRNILLTAQFEPKISDFGLSRVLHSDSNKTASTVGPLRWMAPESLRDQSYSNKTDVWAFGMTLIEIYTAQPPYPKVETGTVAYRVASGLLLPEVPANADGVVQKVMRSCFMANPSERPDFSVICEDLKSLDQK